MPSTIDVRSFGSMRSQSWSNQRFTASNRAASSASAGVSVSSLPTANQCVINPDKLRTKIAHGERRVGAVPDGSS